MGGHFCFNYNFNWRNSCQRVTTNALSVQIQTDQLGKRARRALIHAAVLVQSARSAAPIVREAIDRARMAEIAIELATPVLLEDHRLILSKTALVVLVLNVTANRALIGRLESSVRATLNALRAP